MKLMDFRVPSLLEKGVPYCLYLFSLNKMENESSLKSMEYFLIICAYQVEQCMIVSLMDSILYKFLTKKGRS